MTSFIFEHKKIKKMFEELNVGDTFMMDSNRNEVYTIYMKTERVANEGTAITLNNGNLESFLFDTIVIPVDVIINKIIK